MNVRRSEPDARGFGMKRAVIKSDQHDTKGSDFLPLSSLLSAGISLRRISVNSCNWVDHLSNVCGEMGFTGMRRILMCAREAYAKSICYVASREIPFAPSQFFSRWRIYACHCCSWMLVVKSWSRLKSCQGALLEPDIDNNATCSTTAIML